LTADTPPGLLKPDTPPDLPLNRLLHDNMGTVMNFVFSDWPLLTLMQEIYVGNRASEECQPSGECSLSTDVA
jgi:hypothetical protein